MTDSINAHIPKDMVFNVLAETSGPIQHILKELDIKTSDGDIHSTPETLNRLVVEVAKSSGREYLPYSLGWNYPNCRAGTLFLAMMTANTVYDGLNVLKNYYRRFSLFGEDIAIESREHLMIKVIFPWAMSENKALQGMAVCRVTRLLYDAYGPSFTPSKLSGFDFAQAMKLFFVPDIEIESSENGIVLHYHTSLFGLRQNSADPSTFKHFVNKLKRETVSHSPINTDPVLATDKLFDLLPPAKWNKEEFAKELGLNNRTYDRMLKKYNTNFNALYKRQLRERSINSLIANNSVDFVAEEMGYSERKSFERAFKGWVGITPSSYKNMISDVKLESIRNHLINNDHIPIFSDVTVRIIQCANSDKRSIEDICTIIEKEPVLSAKIISFASSAFFVNYRIDSLKDAISKCLGIESVLAISMPMLMNMKRSPTAFQHVNIKAIWEQILLCSEIILYLQKKYDIDGASWTDIYFASLFKDIGLIYLLYSNEYDILETTDADIFVEKTLSDAGDLIHQRFGILPYTLTTIALTKWGCNDEALQIIRDLQNWNSTQTSVDCYILYYVESVANDLRTKEENELEHCADSLNQYFADCGSVPMIKVEDLITLREVIRKKCDLMFTT